MTLRRVCISLDCMGCDGGPEIVLGGAELSLKRCSGVCDLRFLLFGDAKLLLSMLENYPVVRDVSSVVNSEDDVLPNDKPSYVVRRKRSSSMYKSISSVSEGESDAVVSSGNTGAMVAISRLVLKTLRGVHRPVISAILPRNKPGEETVFLDLGANVDSDADSLVQFAIMGSIFAKIMLHEDKPNVGLLNIGSEDIKGTDSIKLAYSKLIELGEVVNFVGHVEPDRALFEDVHVVVSDGFSGNIALKSFEGAFSVLRSCFREVTKSSLLAKFCVYCIKEKLAKSFRRFDPCYRNGAVLLGLNGVVVKSHGSAGIAAFSNAIEVAVEVVLGEINSKIAHDIALTIVDTK